MNTPATDNTEVKPLTVTFVAVCLGYWGKGKTINDAIAEAVKAGARRTDEFILKGYTGPKEDVWVDGMGSINYQQTGELFDIAKGLVKVSFPKKK